MQSFEIYGCTEYSIGCKIEYFFFTMLSNKAHTLHVPGLQSNNNMVEKIYENKSLKTQSSLSCKIHCPCSR